MKLDEYTAWIKGLVASNDMTAEQGDDLISQGTLAESSYAADQAAHPDKVIGYAAGRLILGTSVHDVLD